MARPFFFLYLGWRKIRPKKGLATRDYNTVQVTYSNILGFLSPHRVEYVMPLTYISS